MALSALSDELMRAEGMMMQDQNEEALELLLRLAEDAEEYVDRNCQTTDEVQYFAFPTLFDRLAYRRVENDPRKLEDVHEPFDCLYGDLAMAYVRTGDYENAMNALKTAIRWNPMNCGFRLDLADLFKIAGDIREHIALTFGVFERASEARHLTRAFLNFAAWFDAQGRLEQTAACLRAARRFEVKDGALEAALDQAAGTPKDPDGLTDEEANDLLEAEGLPTGANAEIAVCLLMCAQDCAAMGDRATATEMTIRARDLVGEQAALTLLQLVRDAAISEGFTAGGNPVSGGASSSVSGEKPDAAETSDGEGK